MTDDSRGRPLLVVIGVAGSGKTTVGKALAVRLGVEYADGDSFHSSANVAKMSAGHALDDVDRVPWLTSIAGWLRAHDGYGGVVSCSALRRRYRDVLRSGAQRITFVHLDGDPAAIAVRLAARPAHFMPASLLDSQLAALEPLQPDEQGVVVDLTLPVDHIVEQVAGKGYNTASIPPST